MNSDNQNFLDNEDLKSEPSRTPTGRLLIVLIAIAILMPACLVIFITTQSNFRVEGSSMQPTFDVGQYVSANRLAYLFNEPERGDIIVFYFPNDRSRTFHKRIIGLPNDTISMMNGDVIVNGVTLEEPYIKDRGPNNQTWTVTDGHYFVVGDNRRNSSDSRSWSFLPEDDIIGRVWLSYWPPQSWQFVSGHDHSGVPDPK